MSDNQSQNSDRWQALDMVKTLGLLGALSGHILIWWFGKNWNVASGATFFDLNGIPNWLATAYMIVVHLILISAGAAFYFYLKHKPTFKKIFSRTALLILFGILLGLNLHPLALFWNVFLFYALSILVIFALDRYSNKKWIAVATIGALIMAPLLRFFLNHIAPENYWSAVLVGDPLGKISFYPFFPWFFLVGSGFLTSYFYSKLHNRRFLSYGVWGGIIIALVAAFFLKPLDFSNVFGAAAQISISYIVFIFGFFVFLVSLLELIFKNRILSKYNPAVAIGRHIFPVYLVTLLVTLPLTDSLKNSQKYGDNIWTFFIIEIATLAIAYLSAVVLTQARAKRETTQNHGLYPGP